jgi:Ala-tRNA(Pro) deacylase
MSCKARLEQYLRESGVIFREMTHRTAYTAQDVAAAQHVTGKHVAKVAMIVADRCMVMLVLPASYRVDLNKLGDVLPEQTIRFAHEAEFAHLFPDCEVGAMPPFGNLYNLPVYVDRALAADDQFIFQAGTHRDTMQITYDDYERLVRPVVVDIAKPAREMETSLLR